MRWQFIFVLLFSFLIYSCESDLTDIGSAIQPSDDAILIRVDSFSVSSSNLDMPFIYSRPDSLLLGTFVDENFGTLYADILTQFQPPVGVSYPDNAVADSAKLIMRYYSWFGDKYSPLEVTVFKMDMNKTFSESALYKSNIDPTEYCSQTNVLGTKVFAAKDYGYVRTDTTSVEVMLSKSFVDDFAVELKKPAYTKDTEVNFQNAFNGMYITTKFGTASMLNIRRIYMRYYYSYPVKRIAADGTVSEVMFGTYQDYPASEEVRTVNRFQLPQKEAVLNSVDATKNIISSPANIYTTVTMPLNTIKDKLYGQVGNKTLLLNRAKFRVNVTDVKDTTLALPLVNSILMIYEDSVDSYFKTRKLPTSKISVLGSLAYEYDDNNDVVYYYSFDMAKILTYELNKKNGAPQQLKFRLVPVSLTYDGSSNIVEIKQQNLLRAVKLCSAVHPEHPMRLDMVYSGF